MKLFENNHSFGLVSLPDLALSFLGKTEDHISLPGFQRNAVWKEEKVEALWDSLLCRFPIGSILLARFEDFREVGHRPIQISRSSPYPDTMIDSQGIGYIVVDGQQRLNALSLGFLPFEPGASARLWIDLAGPRDNQKSVFDFYLCTIDNPFGAGLSKEQKRHALDSIGQADVDDSELRLDNTYPFLARMPVPFYEFVQIINNNLDVHSIHSILARIGELNLIGETFEVVKQRLSQSTTAEGFLRDLIRAIDETISKGYYQIPVILVQKQGNFMTPNRLGKLFERVNISGEVPPQAELFFSALKLRAPMISNYVAGIYNDELVGKLFKPTDIILAALRLVDPRITSLQLERFEKIAKESNEALLELMDHSAEGNSVFSRCIHLAYQTLHYNGSMNDIGLPRQYLASLRPRVWQGITLWIYNNLEAIQKHGISEIERLNIIRYAILDSHNYFLGWQRNLSKYINSASFSTLAANALARPGLFPALQIFQEVQLKASQDNYSIDFFTPSGYHDWLTNGLIPEKPNYNQLNNEHYLLMFAQRRFLSLWEKYHLDADHIVPSMWMVFRAGPTPTSHFWRVPNVESYWRYQVINRAGNKRYWPDSLNRAYHDISPTQKYIHPSLDTQTDELHQKFDLHTVQDVLAASAIDEDLVEDWQAVSEGASRVWNTERFARFRKVVNQRRIRIYNQQFEAMKWSEWVETINKPV